MKFSKKVLFITLLIGFYLPFLAQNETKICIAIDDISKVFRVKQTIQFTNITSKPLSKIILNDWNNAYSDKDSPLGKRFSDEFVRSFHMATESERGNTKIEKLLINGSNSDWARIENQVDLIEITLNKSLSVGETLNITIDYVLKIPDAMFTRFGRDNEDYYVKNCFLTIPKLNPEGEFLKYSNENIEDIVNLNINNVEIDFIIPKNYFLTTNLSLLSENQDETFKTIKTQTSNCTEILFAIEKKSTFESFKNDKIEVETNLKDTRLNPIQKAIIVDKVVNFIAENLGEINQKKLMISQIDYDRNAFYGLNLLPTFLSPFPNDFLYELKFLKAYLYNYLKASLQIDYRKEGYIFDAIQSYIMMSYIEENYPNMKMLGNISKLKILKSYGLVKADFNDQYSLLFLLMARKNLDQSIGDSKESFIKFNEQISGKYKAGLSFRYLDKYLNNNAVSNTFSEYIVLNRAQATTAADFENLLRKNAKQNIDWFFDNLINSRKIIDYKLDKITKTNDSVSVVIKNNSQASVPISIYGFKNKTLVFQKWLNPIQKDTTLTFEKSLANKLVLNYNNEVPEYNLRNNSKTLKGFFSQNRPIKFSFFRDIEDPKYNQIFYVPDFGFNLYDGAIVSMSFNNKSLLLDRPFTFDFKPSYSTQTSSITGSGGISFVDLNRDSKLYSVKYGLSAAYFHYDRDAAYLRLNPFLQLRFRENDFRNNKRKYLNFRQIIVNKELAPPSDDPDAVVDDSPMNYSIFDARFINQNAEMNKGFSYSTGVQFSSAFGKMTSELYYRKLFNNNYQISARVFAGTFLYKKTDTEFYSFGLDRPKDYMFDYNFYGRSETEGFYSQQIIIAEGGFKSKFSNPYANQWMTTANVTSSVWHWIQLYGDAGFYKNKGKNINFVYDSGLHLNLVPDFFEVFLPAYSSNGFEPAQKNYHQKIRVMFTISPRTLINLFTRKWF